MNSELDRMGASAAEKDYTLYPAMFSLTHNSETWSGDPLTFLTLTHAVADAAGPAVMMAALAGG